MKGCYLGFESVYRSLERRQRYYSKMSHKISLLVMILSLLSTHQLCDARIFTNNPERLLRKVESSNQENSFGYDDTLKTNKLGEKQERKMIRRNADLSTEENKETFEILNTSMLEPDHASFYYYERTEVSNLMLALTILVMLALFGLVVTLITCYWQKRYCCPDVDFYDSFHRKCKRARSSIYDDEDDYLLRF